MKQHNPTLVIALSLVIGGCASSGTKPHDMSVEQHERAAQAEQDEAKAHADQYDPSLEGTEELCPGGLICWTTWSNPTAEHNQEANRHRQLAKKHREAAEALRTAEAQACVGVDERDRDLSPFFHAPDIQRVTVPTPESQNPVEVVFRPVQGLTEAGLQKLVDCHIARSAATGHEMPDMDYCPLVPRGVQAAVSTRDGAFVVTISVENNERDARAEVLKRATALEQRTKAG